MLTFTSAAFVVTASNGTPLLRSVSSFGAVCSVLLKGMMMRSSKATTTVLGLCGEFIK